MIINSPPSRMTTTRPISVTLNREGFVDKYSKSRLERKNIIVDEDFDTNRLAGSKSEYDNSIKLVKNINRINKNLQSNSQYILPGFGESFKSKGFHRISDFQQKKGLIQRDSEQRFKDNIKLFNIVNTFVDLSDDFQKASQMQKIHQYLEQKKIFDERKKKSTFNNFQDIDMKRVESKIKKTKKSSENVESPLLSKVKVWINRKSLKEGINLRSSKTNLVDNAEKLNQTTKNDSVPDNITSELLLSPNANQLNVQLSKESDDLGTKLDSKMLTVQNQIIEHCMKEPSTKYPMNVEGENQLDFYEKIESGQLFLQSDDKKRLKSFRRKKEADMVDNNIQHDHNQNEMINPYDPEIINQDAQKVLINNLENYLIKSKKLIIKANHRSKTIYKYGKESLERKENGSMPQSPMRTRVFLERSQTACDDNDAEDNSKNNKFSELNFPKTATNFEGRWREKTNSCDNNFKLNQSNEMMGFKPSTPGMILGQNQICIPFNKGNDDSQDLSDIQEYQNNADNLNDILLNQHRRKVHSHDMFSTTTRRFLASQKMSSSKQTDRNKNCFSEKLMQNRIFYKLNPTLKTLHRSTKSLGKESLKINPLSNDSPNETKARNRLFFSSNSSWSHKNTHLMGKIQEKLQVRSNTRKNLVDLNQIIGNIDEIARQSKVEMKDMIKNKAGIDDPTNTLANKAGSVLDMPNQDKNSKKNYFKLHKLISITATNFKLKDLDA